MSKRSKVILFLLIGTPVLITILYFTTFQYLVADAYYNKAPGWFESVVNWLYPRFTAEKNRFGLDFFLAKTDQMLIRTWLVFIGMAVLYWSTNSVGFIKQKWRNYWNQQITSSYQRLIVTLFCVCLFVTTFDWYLDFYNIENLAPFYKPILPYRLLHLPLPGSSMLLALYGLMLFSALACVMNFRVRLFFPVMFILFIYLQGIFYCFEKTDHGYVTFTYVGFSLLFLVASPKKGQAVMGKWPVVLGQVLVSLVYFQAGLEKLLVSGFTWASGETFQNYLLAHPTDWGLWIAESDVLCAVLSCLTLLFQLTFPIVLFQPKLKWYYLSYGIVFHFGTTFLMGISTYLNPWIMAYLIFIDWSLLPQYGVLKKNLKRIKSQG